MNAQQNSKLLPDIAVLTALILATGPWASAGTTAYRDVILADNPIVYYEFDETSGTTAANSATTGTTYTGTISTTGGAVTINQFSFAQGGTAYDFGGGAVLSANALQNSLTAWTVEAWVNYDSAKTTASNFLGNDQGGWNDDVLIGIGPEDGARGIGPGNVGIIHQDNANTTRDFVGAALSAGEWHHVVITGENGTGAGTSTLTLYINGVQVAQNSTIAGNVTFNGDGGIGTPNLTVGAAGPDAYGGRRPYDGLLDEVAIYDSVLDATTILNHYTVGSSTASVPPVIATLSPADDSSGVLISSDLVATFSEPVVLTGNGTVTIRNLTLGSGSDIVIPLPDPQVTVSGSTLTINPATDLAVATSYAIRITGDAIEDVDGEAFDGLLDDNAWHFATAAPPGLVGKWEFESEAGGVTPDSSGNGHDGTLEGNANLTMDAERGSVLELSGLGVDADAVDIDAILEIPTLPSGRGVTLAAWIKRNADASAGDIYSYVIGLGDSGDIPIVTLGIDDATGLVKGFIEGELAGNDQVDVDGDTVVTDGVWTHIAVTYNRINNEGITYVNGVAQGSPTDISAAGDGALDWNFATIGRRTNVSGLDSAHFGGLIDDVCYYDEVLTPAEIAALAETGGDSFSDWVDGFFPGETDPAIIGLDADPDGDGIDNGIENFFGTRPDQFNQGLQAADVTGNQFTFTHPVSDNPATDLTAGYRWSKDLVTFTPSGDSHDGTTVTITPGAPTGGFVTVTADVSGTSTSRLFVRVEVTQP
ncbi:LamG-like jellyroll fold domain-containing protein [Haloferula sp. A504]|uniref:LamG-like jellyroll fold domain-containing protein n=1 Tax=Haloferula sp. A504 TaxID=3373601 RepID=UPI0031CB818E|nr:Ig-like domain-containing protein [Verrucomicrobiaceae bacterium E54]